MPSTTMKKLTTLAALVVSTLAFAGAPSTTSTAPVEKKKAAKVVSSRGTGTSAPKDKEATSTPTAEPSTGTR